MAFIVVVRESKEAKRGMLFGTVLSVAMKQELVDTNCFIQGQMNYLKLGVGVVVGGGGK